MVKNSIILSFMASIVSTSAMCAPVHDVAKLTNEYMKVMHRYVSSTNKTSGSEVWSMWLPRYVETNSAFCAEVDAVLVQKPPLDILRMYKWETCSQIFPRTYSAALAQYKDSYPYLVKMRKGESLSREEHAAAVIEESDFRLDSRVRRAREQIGKALSPLVIPTLRRQGKAITVGLDGVSPVKVFADRISAAINAPGMSGLNDILVELGVPARIDPVARCIPTVEEARAMVNKIMSGYLDANNHTLGAINIALGTDEYNAFTERFNGGTR